MTPLFAKRLLFALASAVFSTFGLLSSAPVAAFDVGLRPYAVPASEGKPEISVALFYPTRVSSRDVAMGPFKLRVAMGAEPEASFKGLIVISHGTGGSEFGHAQIAQALAADGFLVAALRHPGDNWQDRSLLMKASGNQYFDERPRQLSRVIDALLADTRWGAVVAKDERGQRIGAVGHSAGGYSVLALAGAQPDSRRVLEHCQKESAADPVFCELARSRDAAVQRSERDDAAAQNGKTARPLPSLRDGRVRAVAALSPLAVVIDPTSLAAIRVPVSLHVAGLDRFLVPKYHGVQAANLIPGARLSLETNAGHFAFMDKPNMPILTEDGDIGADPAGFDRAAYLRKLAADLLRFFDEKL